MFDKVEKKSTSWYM